MQLLLAFIVAMAVTMALVPLLMRWAGALRVIDSPAERKVHAAPMPRVGGIAMLAGILVALALWLPRDDTRLLAYLAGAAIIFAFGVWDDREDLPPSMKLAGQLIGVRSDEAVDREGQFVCGDLGFGADTPVLHHLGMVAGA